MTDRRLYLRIAELERVLRDCELGFAAVALSADTAENRDWASQQRKAVVDVLAGNAANPDSAQPTRQAWRNDGHTWECNYHHLSDTSCTCDRPGLKAVGKDWPTDPTLGERNG